MRVNDLWAWIRERHAIYLRRAAGKPKPWTKDEILQSFRFCNVYRELDTVTIWIRENWREPYFNDKNLWFAMVVARLINWPESLDDCAHGVFRNGKVDWRPEVFTRALDIRKAAGEKVFTGAYMIHADATPTASKAGYLAARVLTPMWEERKNAQIVLEHNSLATFHCWLTEFRDMGSFMAAQVIADLKYTPSLETATDWVSWAAPGPGSMRGLNRVCGRDKGEKWKPGEWLATLRELREKIGPLVKKADMEPIHAQDLQNCLCEFDKYERVRLGEGKPRSLYNGRG